VRYNPKGYANDHDSFGLVYHDSFALMILKIAQKLTGVSDRLEVSACAISVVYMLQW
jgi:hypothetical protein